MAKGCESVQPVLRPASAKQLGAVRKSLNKWQRSAWLKCRRGGQDVSKDGPGSASTVCPSGLDELEGFGPVRMMGTQLVNDAPRKSQGGGAKASASTSVLRRWKRLKPAEPLIVN